MKKISSALALALVAAACGGQNGDKTQNPVETTAAVGEPITFDQNMVETLSTEAQDIPAAMIVRVPVGENGQELIEKAELRAAEQIPNEQSADSIWAQAQVQQSPSEDDKFVLVNPSASQQAPAFEQSRQVQRPVQLPVQGPVRGPVLGGDDVLSNNATNSRGNNGLIVTGSNNYTYFNNIVTGSNVSNGNGNVTGAGRYQNYGPRQYSYTHRPYRHSGYCGPVRVCAQPVFHNYYMHGYRPVWRSPGFGFGGYNGYWGYLTAPRCYRYAGYRYYVYPRPAHVGINVNVGVGFGVGY